MNTKELKILLQETGYDHEKTKTLIDSFENGFDLGYRGRMDVKMTAKNLKFTIGDEVELWNKVMKEVEAKRYAGPFKQIPFENYIQSPIGLVPKDGGKKTRLIFHLSYPRGADPPQSVNANTPESLSKVKYKEFDDAVRLCIKEGRGCHAGKSDLTSAFRHLGIAKKWWKFLVMKAKNPLDGNWYYFIDKCLPFGASISCAHFQSFSNALSHIVATKTGKENINYLDDFFFVEFLKLLCNQQLKTFLKICKRVNFPVSMEKTFWGNTTIVFLGLLIDTELQMICIPVEKITRALELIEKMLQRPSRKTTLGEVQKLASFLNFLGKCIVPGRAFTRRLYMAISGLTKKHHHLKITGEIKQDLTMWKTFLSQPETYNREFFEFDKNHTSLEIDMYTDATRNYQLGAGGYCKDKWFILQWDEEFMESANLSINYLELYGVLIAVYNWLHMFKNMSITLFCDNISVVQMINNTSSNCRNCMVLIRMMVLKMLSHNTRIKAKHVPGHLNKYSDLLSRHKYKLFWQLARKNSSIGARHLKHGIFFLSPQCSLYGGFNRFAITFWACF